jgi:hypothetical protein
MYPRWKRQEFLVNQLFDNLDVDAEFTTLHESSHLAERMRSDTAIRWAVVSAPDALAAPIWRFSAHDVVSRGNCADAARASGNSCFGG